MTIDVELYRDDQTTGLPEGQEEKDAQHRQNLVSVLGFNPEVQCAPEPWKYYPEMTGLELAVWTLFLPTYYQRSVGGWQKYSFDRVPTSVLEEINFALSLEVFDDVELWTPEQPVRASVPVTDPLVVGVSGHPRSFRGVSTYDWGNNFAYQHPQTRFFRITRWGESLQPFEDIKRQVMVSRMAPTWKGEYVVPEGILNYALPLFEASPYETIHLDRAGAFSRHCDQRKLKVNNQPVCVVCGAV